MGIIKPEQQHRGAGAADAIGSKCSGDTFFGVKTKKYLTGGCEGVRREGNTNIREGRKNLSRHVANNVTSSTRQQTEVEPRLSERELSLMHHARDIVRDTRRLETQAEEKGEGDIRRQLVTASKCEGGHSRGA